MNTVALTPGTPCKLSLGTVRVPDSRSRGREVQYVCLVMDGHGVTMSGADARDLAAALIRVADKVDADRLVTLNGGGA